MLRAMEGSGWMMVGLGALLVGCGPAVQLESADEVAGGSGGESGDPGEPSIDGEPDEACVSAPTPCESCVEWVAEYEGSTDRDDSFVDVLVAPEGDVVGLGGENRERLYTSLVGDALVARYSPQGDLLWTQSFTDPQAQMHVAAGAFDASGALVAAIVGIRRDQDPPTFFSRIVRLDAEGNELGGGLSLPDVVVARLFRSGSNVLLQTYDPDDPDSSFELHQLGPDGTTTLRMDPSVLPTSDIVVSGVFPGPDGVLLLAGSRNYTMPWLGQWGDEELDWALESVQDVGEGWISSAAALSDGSIVYAAVARNDDTGTVPVLGRLSPDGDPMWTRTYPASGCCANGLDTVQVDTTDRVFAWGAFGLDNGGLGTRLVSVDACTGDPQWTWDSTEGSLTNFPGGLAFAPADDAVYVSGSLAPLGPNGRAWITRLEI